jgi:probable phosphoglycerate mutase
MRHAQTVFNTRRLIQGSCDSALTALGREQARAAGRLLQQRGITFSRALCSTQERASDTLEIATTEAFGSPMPYERLKGLKEMNFGAFEAGVAELYDPDFIENDPDYYASYGGETIREVQFRMRDSIVHALEETGDGNVLAVSSNTAILAFAASVGLGVKREGLLIPNCSILVLDYDGSDFSLREMLVPDVVAGASRSSW